MNVLSGTALAEAFITCDKNEGAKIGIVCSGSMAARTMIDSLWEEISGHRLPGWEMGREVSGCRATLRKRVKSEYSTIEIFSPITVDNIRGRSYHQVLYDRYLDPIFIKELGWCERLSFDAIEDGGSEALDEFLNSFKIV